MRLFKAISGMFILTSTFLSSVSIFAVNAAEVEVNWQNSEKYRDVHAGDGHREKFKANTFKQIEDHIAKLAQKLPNGYQLILNVDDLDLAGDVNHGGIRRIRIIKNIYFPRMKFSYQLLSPSQEQVLSDDVDLKDMGFLNHVSLKYQQQVLSYEKQMLDDWFKETFAQYLVGKK